MKKVISTALLIAGLVLVAGLAGAEDMAFAAGQAGRPLASLVLWGLVGCGMMGIGVAGLSR